MYVLLCFSFFVYYTVFEMGILLGCYVTSQLSSPFNMESFHLKLVNNITSLFTCKGARKGIYVRNKGKNTSTRLGKKAIVLTDA